PPLSPVGHATTAASPAPPAAQSEELPAPESVRPQGADGVRVEGTEGADAERPSVDELFARLRAEREAARRDADAIFSDLPAPGPGRAGSDAEPGRAEVPAVEPETAVAAASGGPEGGGATGAGEPVGEAAGQELRAEPPAEESSEDSQENWLQRRNQMLAPVHDRLARKLKRTLQDDQNDLLDRVRSSTRHPQAEPLPPESDHQARFAAAAEPILGEAFERGSEFARSALPGVSGGDSGAAHTRSVARALAADLVGDLRVRLSRAVAEPGFDEAGLADLVGSAYRSWKGARIEGLAMDHLVAAFERGVLASVPPEARLVWVVDDDGGPCPDCDDNGLAGATTAGSEYPTGQTHPPAHPGCRCLLVPALT
ncbi:MAG: hypothetical protein ACYCS2_10575, partial [Acidimicrobiales bacterium]